MTIFQSDVVEGNIVRGIYRNPEDGEKYYEYRLITKVETALGATIVQFERLVPEGDCGLHEETLSAFLNWGFDVFPQATDYKTLEAGWRYYMPLYKTYFDVLAVNGDRVTFRYVGENERPQTAEIWWLCQRAFNKDEPSPKFKDAG